MNFLDNYYTVGSKIRTVEARREYFTAVVEFFYTGEMPEFEHETAEIGFAGVLYSLKKARAGKVGGEAAPKAKRERIANESRTNREQEEEEEEEEEVAAKAATTPKAPAEVVCKIIGHLNERTGKAYRTNCESTTRKISARLNEGYTVENFLTVIDNKVADWGTDAKMARFLRPSTLFGPKFEDYLNEGTVTNSAESAYSGLF